MRRLSVALWSVLALGACTGEPEGAQQADVAVVEQSAREPLPQPVRDCATQYDGLKGGGFTLANAEKLEKSCQAAMADAPRQCGSFLAAAGRTGFKAAALIKSDFADAAMQPLTWAREDAQANRATCGV